MEKLKDNFIGLKNKALEVAEKQRRSFEEDEEDDEEKEKLKELKSTAYSPYYREYRILIEYKHLLEKIPSGVYIVPSFDTTFVWHGVIFIRQGLYRSAIFKFIIDIPHTYPAERPSLHFTSRVVHPQVDEKGVLNLVKEFPVWTEQHFLWHLLSHMKKIFYRIEAENAVNEEAARLWKEDEEKYSQVVVECVEESVKNVYINREDTSLRFKEWKEEYEPTHAAIVNRKLEEEKESVLSWLSSLSNVSKIWNIKY